MNDTNNSNANYDLVQSMLKSLRPTTLIELANDLSNEIDEMAMDQGAIAPAYHQLLRAMFDDTCHELRVHGGDDYVVDNVRCPTNI